MSTLGTIFTYCRFYNAKQSKHNLTFLHTTCLHYPNKLRTNRGGMATEKKLKSGIYADTRGICKEAAALFDMEFEPNAMELIGELSWKKLLLYGQDLEAFHKHGKRSTNTIDDVKLLCRRNPSLKEFIEKECPTTSKADAGTANKKKRKAAAPIIID